jgi:hypothetical protein
MGLINWLEIVGKIFFVVLGICGLVSALFNAGRAFIYIIYEAFPFYSDFILWRINKKEFRQWLNLKKF